MTMTPSTTKQRQNVAGTRLTSLRCAVCDAALPTPARAARPQLRSCDGCGHTYVAGLPNEDQRWRRVEARDAHRTPAQRQLKELRRVLVDRRTGLLRVQHDLLTLRGPCTVVDASAAAGGLLWAAKSSGYTVHGLERSASLRALARQYHGVDLEDGDLFDNKVRPHSADVLVLSHDLDESADPRALLAAAQRVVSPNGFLLVECYDAERLDVPEDVDDEDWTLHARPHRFRAAEVVRLLSQSGFNLLDLYCPTEDILVAIGAPA